MIDWANLPYVHATYQGPRPAGMVPNLILIHSGETGEGSTAAEGMANWFARPAPRPNPNDVGSAHLCVDNDSAVRCAPDEHRTNGAGGVNNFALHLELAGRAGQLPAEWGDPYSSDTIRNGADGVRTLWLPKYRHIRPVFLDAGALARGERDGITTHAEVSKVFAGNDGHWDPGPHFPIDAFLDLVRGDAQDPPPPRRSRMFPFLVRAPEHPYKVYLYDPNTGRARYISTTEELNALSAVLMITPGANPEVLEHDLARTLLAHAEKIG